MLFRKLTPGHAITIIGTAIATYAVPLLPFIPPRYQPIVAAATAAAGALWHLWMTSPWA